MFSSICISKTFRYLFSMIAYLWNHQIYFSSIVYFKTIIYLFSSIMYFKNLQILVFLNCVFQNLYILLSSFVYFQSDVCFSHLRISQTIRYLFSSIGYYENLQKFVFLYCVLRKPSNIFVFRNFIFPKPLNICFL